MKTTLSPSILPSCRRKVLPAVLVALLTLAATPLRAQQPCEFFIVGDFESRCMVLQKPGYIEDMESPLVACQGMTVTYSVLPAPSGPNPPVWVWSVSGADSFTDNNDGTATVVWGTGSAGLLTVTDGDGCTLSRPVQIVEPPSVGAESTPSYTIDASGQKVITLCYGSPLTFVDRSTADENGIAGIYWRSSAGTASTAEYTIAGVTHADTVVHRVYNRCGCYDEERFVVRVVQGGELDLGCYGTVCEDATVTYTALSPSSCSSYVWYVDGGTIVDGQYTSAVTVQWDRPQDGYGVIALDGDLCGGSACPALLSRRIPIVQDRLPVDGPATVCEGAREEYSLPLLSATEYIWSVTPSANVQMHLVNGANRIHLVFEQPGTYTVKAAYRCDILGCGPYESEALTVTVLPPLAVTGPGRICFGDACSLATNPVATATWSVYDMTDETDLPALSATGTTFSTSAFPHPGRYRITASSPLHCRSAAFMLTVEDLPPQADVADLDPDNPTTACLFSSIRLQGNPTNPKYTLLWAPDCPAASPATTALVSGNEATINYGNDVCNVNAYLFDRATGCRSKAPYVHTVKLFEPETLTLHPLTVCPGATVVFNGNNVPWQDGMLYRWELQQNMQHCATVVGDATTNTINLKINGLNSVSYPYSFYIDLIRNWCGNLSDTHRVVITVTTTPPPAAITVTPNPAVICPGQTVELTATGCGTEYVWSVGNSDGSPGGSTWQWQGILGGLYTIHAACSSYDFCNNSAYFASGSAQVTVHPGPLYTGLAYDDLTGVIYLQGTSMPNDQYQWALDGNTITGATSSSIACQGAGTYSCTVTDADGCTQIYSLYVPIPCLSNCTPISVVEDNYDKCSGVLTMHAVTLSPTSVSWIVNGGEYSDLTPVSNNTATVKLESTGVYQIVAYTGNPSLCERGTLTKTVTFLPDFQLAVKCSDIIVHNQSKYTDGTHTVTFQLFNDYPGGTLVGQQTMTLSSPSCTFHTGATGTYYVLLTEYNGTPYHCRIGMAVVETDGASLLSIVTANSHDQGKTCDNIPIKLTASLSGGESIVSTHWDFGDNSFLDKNGNSVYHTYEKDLYNPYTITATVTDVYKCQHTGTLSIESIDNYLKAGEVVYDQPWVWVCPYINSKELHYTDNNIFYDPDGDYYWWWSSGNAQDTPPFYVYSTNDYTVRVRDHNYCLFQSMKNVPFLQHPTAAIAPDRELFCVGDEVFFHGSPGPDSSLYSYTWRVTLPTVPPQTVTLPCTTATAPYTPRQAGTYTIELELKNNDGCIDVATYTFYVHPAPTPPTVSYNGNRCIHTPPVVLQGSGSSAGLYHWSCGDYGNKGYYFYPARATAYYYDPATGCRSDTAGITIEPAPNMDAVLSGCYAFCDDVNKLKVWGLTTFEQSVNWEWFKDWVSVQTGSGNYLSYPLLLPLSGFGTYYLNARYDGGACSVASHDLVITSTDYCPCDSLEVSYTYTMNIVNCHLEYTLFVTVTNNSLRNTNCLQEIEWLDMAGDNTMTTDFTPTMLGPGRSYYFKINLIVNNLLPSHATFRITDNCRYCIKDFDFDFVPTIPCDDGMTMISVAPNPYLASTVAGYFDICFDLAQGGLTPDALLAFWCEPPMVVDYTFIPLSGYVQGLGMLDLGLLRQMAARDEKICFYAVTCRGNTLCKLHYCLSAVDLLELLEFPDPDKGKREAAGESVPGEIGLHPNPATGRVEVTGAEGRVEEVVVMDMYGRQVAQFGDAGSIDVSDLATGSYIVRIKVSGTQGTEVYYRKLIKR